MFNDNDKKFYNKIINTVAMYLAMYTDHINYSIKCYTFYVIVFIVLNDNQLKIDMMSEN